MGVCVCVCSCVGVFMYVCERVCVCVCVCVCPSTFRSSCNDAVWPATCPARVRHHVEKRPAQANVDISEKRVMSPASMILPCCPISSCHCGQKDRQSV